VTDLLQTPLAFFPLAAVTMIVVFAGLIDVWKLRISNKITYSLLLSGCAYHAITGGLAGVQTSLLGAGFGFAILLVPYLLGAMGAGDVKLLAGVGAWLGLPATVSVFVIAALLNGVYSAGLLISRGELWRGFATVKIAMFQFYTLGRHLGSEERVETVAASSNRRQRLIPFAMMVAIGVLAVAVLQGPK